MSTQPVLATRTVGVLGSGSEPHIELAEPLGRLLATLGVNLLTGGGGGTMEAVARSYLDAGPSRGISIGILPASRSAAGRAPPGYPNGCVQLAISTHLPDRGRKGQLPTSRNHVNVLSSDVLIALPGGFGTEAEVRLALEYGKPIAVFSHEESSVSELVSPVQRLRTIEDVEIFLRGELNRQAAT
jgi:uncharacterized protein (TIGR00725 family)